LAQAIFGSNIRSALVVVSILKGRTALGSGMSEPSPKEAKTEEQGGSKGGGALHPELQKKLEEYRAKRAFDPTKWADDKCAKFNEYMRTCRLSGCVVSVSGGVDSALTLALCMHAKKMEGSPIKRVVGLCQPIHSSDWALARGKENITAAGAELVVVDQTDLHTQLAGLVEKGVGVEGKSFAQGQLRSYMRTPVGYYVAQLVSQGGHPCVVMGTGNMDEDGYLAYFCKAGDGVVDVQLISDIHKSEVFKVSAQLGVPENTLKAPPSADLWDGQTDEEELGFSYDFIELFTGAFLPLSEEARTAFTASLSAEAQEEFKKSRALAEAVHNRNKHKIGGVKNL